NRCPVEQPKFLSGLHRRRVLFVRDTKLRQNTKHPLRLFFVRDLLFLFSRLSLRGSVLLTSRKLDGNHREENESDRSQIHRFEDASANVNGSKEVRTFRRCTIGSIDGHSVEDLA